MINFFNIKLSFILAITLVFLVTGCAAQNSKDMPDGIIAHLPAPITNNAIALVGDTAYSFAGLHVGKTWQDASPNAYACGLDQGICRTLLPLPDGVGRLAAIAATVQGKVYIFGGYTVAEDGAEKSTPEVWIFNPKEENYARAADMPVPVDDVVALVYQDRYIYLVSGWHDTGNVDLVQVLDTKENRWFNANTYPGNPVFGHAGGMTGHTMVICDGVKIVPPPADGGRRSFVGSAQCWRGDIDVSDPAAINWRQLRSLPPAHYRMASTAYDEKIVFIGGTANPYNYNGIGYDDAPSKPVKHVWAYDTNKDKFEILQDMPVASMDHRGALLWRERIVILGGMAEDQRVMNEVRIFSPQPR